MISRAKLELAREPTVWWQLTSATVLMFGLVLCVNLFTDALRDALEGHGRDSLFTKGTAARTAATPMPMSTATNGTNIAVTCAVMLAKP